MAKKRKTNKIPVLRSFLIFCEGKKTEVNYLKSYIHSLKLNSKLARVEPLFINKTNPWGIVNEACAQKKKIEKDAPKGCEFWVAFDKDTHAKLPESFKKAKDNGLKVAFSSICFELWFLLHYVTNPAHAVDCTAHNTALKQYVTDYEKKSDCMYEILCDKTDDAKRNAIRIRNMGNGPIYNRYPYTDVDKLLEAIDKFKEDHNLSP